MRWLNSRLVGDQASCFHHYWWCDSVFLPQWHAPLRFEEQELSESNHFLQCIAEQGLVILLSPDRWWDPIILAGCQKPLVAWRGWEGHRRVDSEDSGKIWCTNHGISVSVIGTKKLAVSSLVRFLKLWGIPILEVLSIWKCLHLTSEWLKQRNWHEKPSILSTS